MAAAVLPKEEEATFMLFASLPLERDPLQWGQLPLAFLQWVQNTGGVAALGLTLWLLARTLQREPVLMLSTAIPAARRRLLTNLFVGGTLLSLAGYGFVLLVWLGQSLGMQRLANWFPHAQPVQNLTVGDYSLLISGFLAVVLVAAPPVWSVCTRMRFGRIWAIARLSLKEAVRGRIVWIFGAMALVFLFADWFVPHKPEDQLRNYVRVVYWSLTPLFLLTACLLGAFSIPTDVRNNAIHTIVTKPVEKFEIVLGRFLGYGLMLTAGLFVTACLSLVYVVRGVNEEAARESYTAREVIYGQLHFAGTKKTMEGDSVGREWSYRSYITGPTRSKPNANLQYAIWDFAEVPTELAHRDDAIPFEFSFDIFRLSKGEEGKGVYCTFSFTDGTRQASELKSLVQALQEESDKLEEAVKKQYDRTVGDNPVEANKDRKSRRETNQRQLVKKYRVYQVRAVEVTDYHTQTIEVPSFVFLELFADPASRKGAGGISLPMLRTMVSVDISREAQMLGVARPDFYLLADEKPFWLNFLKGTLGLWCTLMLVLGVAIACSTYLSSVISLLCTLFLYVSGLCIAYLKEVAERRLGSGGPTESFLRVTKQIPEAIELESSPTTSVVQAVDQLFSWGIGRILNLIPDINRHDLHKYVANGYDIGWTDVLLVDNFLPLVGYLLPWAILAYYLMKYREIANPS